MAETVKDWLEAIDQATFEELEHDSEKRKVSARAKVDQPFVYVKRHFSYKKVQYRGLAKNTQRIALLLVFRNLRIAGCYTTG